MIGGTSLFGGSGTIFSTDAGALVIAVLQCRRCRIPIGLHPVFRRPEMPGAARPELRWLNLGRTYPGTVEPHPPLFAIDQVFTDLTAVPARGGGVADASQLPLAQKSEELLQIEGLDSGAALANLADGYLVRLFWQKEHFPSPAALAQ